MQRTMMKSLVLSASTTALLTGAYAQPASNEPSEEIVVTGTRIARDPNLASPQPVQSISRDSFLRSGEFSVADVLLETPGLTASTTADQSLDSGFSAGTSVLNLRGLGTERTLTLVNGRRHVSGIASSQQVDIGTIPDNLVERVEVLTGGASAVYGADAVTGVVNFILRRDYEGVEVNVRGGISEQADGEQFSASLLAGRNFFDGRWNVTFSAQADYDGGLRAGDRIFSRNNNVENDFSNPDLRFQRGDISAASTPNFDQFYGFENTGRFRFGLPIPSADAFIADYEAEFGAAPNLTSAEQALFDRAANAPSRAFLPQPTFAISSTGGVITDANFSLAPGVDVNSNGQDDCLESFVGYNNSLDGAESFGLAGGCWVIDPDGTVRPYQDGLVAGNFNQFGGDGIETTFDEDFIIPEQQRYAFNFLTSFEATDWATLFFEGKYVYQDVTDGGPLNTFYDLLTGSPDNPFLPEELRPLAEESGGLFITRDPADLGGNQTDNERRTYRFVGGVEGSLFDNTFNYNISANYGRFERRQTNRNAVLVDRWFAAIDVVTDPATGQPVCRSDIDPDTLPPTTIFDIPAFDAGFFTFQPGDGQCEPANIWGGRGSISPESVEFITENVVDNFTLEQFVVTALFDGNTEEFFSFPTGGPIGWVFGFEYRDEESDSDISDLGVGLLPQPVQATYDASITVPAGTDVAVATDDPNDIGDVVVDSLIFDPSAQVTDFGGSYDVWEVFGEIQLPLLNDLPFAYNAELGAAVRYADYSTIGSALTWSVNGAYAPIQGLSFRGTYGVAVRAPNIFELFSPPQGATFRPVDPCDINEINALRQADPATAEIREANCIADLSALGVDFSQGFTFEDPLSARFFGTSGGNPNVQEETATTYTIGFVFSPTFLEGLDMTFDYYNIEIEDGIASPTSQDIVDNCYDSANFPNQFCGQFTRNGNPESPQFGGFNFLAQQQVNFGRIETAGIDGTVQYQRMLFGIDWTARVTGNLVDRLDFFFDPGDPSAVDPELGEIQRPEWSGVAALAGRYGPVSLQWSTVFQDRVTLFGAEIETVDARFGENGFSDRVFIHDFSLVADARENMRIFAGVNNIFDRKPFRTAIALPVSPRGRNFFLGVNYIF